MGFGGQEWQTVMRRQVGTGEIGVDDALPVSRFQVGHLGSRDVTGDIEPEIDSIHQVSGRRDRPRHGIRITHVNRHAMQRRFISLFNLARRGDDRPSVGYQFGCQSPANASPCTPDHSCSHRRLPPV